MFEQIGRRPLVKCALAVLALLHASAIFAPFIASDRPYVLEAVDTKSYDDARKSLVGIVGSVRDRAKEGRETYATKGRNLSFDEALDSEVSAFTMRTELMEPYLSEAENAPLQSLESEFLALVDSTRSGEANAAETGASLFGRAKEVRKELQPKKDDRPGVELRSSRTYPLLKSITALEIFFMVLWLFILSWPLWNWIWNARNGNDPDLLRASRRTKLRTVLGASFVAAVLWQLIVGGALTFETASYKDHLSSGQIVATTAVFPPFPIGFAETHIEEPYRPPTWTKNSTVDDEGNYMYGARRPIPNPTTGVVPDGSPIEVRYAESERNGTFRHFLGTDNLGRDMFVRMLWGGRISLSVGILSTILLLLIGVSVGAIAGYFGGRVDLVLSRLIEIVQSIPAFFLILVAVAIVPAEVLHPILAIVVVMALVRWTGIARLVRGEFLKLKDQDYVVAARACGLSPARVIFRHILPNALGPVLVAAAFSVAAGILTESAISYLGFGVKHPIPSWGSVLNASKSAEHWWIQIFPGVLIFITVFCYNIVGEGLRDALDPRMKV